MELGEIEFKSAKRTFFAVNLPEEIKREIAEKFIAGIPKEKWRIVLPKNLHVTMRFLGYLPDSAMRELREKAEALADFGCFELELKGIGHFKNRVLWIGTGKGTSEISILAGKLNSALGTADEKFHAHITLARNRGSKSDETDRLMEKLRKQNFNAVIKVESIDLMESRLHKAGPEYTKVFSVHLSGTCTKEE